MDGWQLSLSLSYRHLSLTLAFSAQSGSRYPSEPVRLPTVGDPDCMDIYCTTGSKRTTVRQDHQILRGSRDSRTLQPGHAFRSLYVLRQNGLPMAFNSEACRHVIPVMNLYDSFRDKPSTLITPTSSCARFLVKCDKLDQPALGAVFQVRFRHPSLVSHMSADVCLCPSWSALQLYRVAEGTAEESERDPEDRLTDVVASHRSNKNGVKSRGKGKSIDKGKQRAGATQPAIGQAPGIGPSSSTNFCWFNPKQTTCATEYVCR